MASLDIHEVDGALEWFAQNAQNGSFEELAKELLMAGAEECVRVMQRRTRSAHHVTGGLEKSIEIGRISRSGDGFKVDVYPEGYNANRQPYPEIANAIEKGIGHNPTRRGTANKTGDHFWTVNQSEIDQKVLTAMDRAFLAMKGE